ncbi:MULTISPECIES: 7-cyano-7-deazaguanine synthase QueC [Thermoactinomyces]|jgi:7-cyano-7-deazaguanine synthase|uniref:7-cyano-7-deazaguanine synthase n=1 Tax=Thermoactinomyces daqus TaxID=1329516 RepID=A0A7W1X9R5_9BACL|nr:MULTISPECIES: 7-cyano-7-deazaguanine synthase QueC [Thermoactinomyces]MBA4542748.1 7-cyano-7-deazaguanine synthase QueC [Thermoactinomyces daqus]MBH8598581.1 7-cyano-7-deazaguanine synthase QueC [Thermoactinomyces sp. CICC 10523]MBH8604575.1 7-cyano-7-deazaguanine synthase QueC [Thermoactinomyces sp. CICC 10522]MBH8606965.1 7-cyano-7-deazaguanine synthase QueC [Thermoactinomyces sp. CICC 10521]
MSNRAVVVLSGGLDSTTCMGIAKEAGYELYPITFYYQQRHDKEVEHAKKVAAFYGVEQRHKIVNVSFLGDIGGSALTDEAIEVQTGGVQDGIPDTYVPARNLIFLSLATAYAEVIGAEKIYTGVTAVDYSGYPDCRPEFIAAMTETINLATKMGVTSEGKLSIETPLIHWSKAEIIRRGLELGVPYELTTSCYLGGEEACGECDSCLLRLKGFAENNATDPIPYKKIPSQFR